MKFSQGAFYLLAFEVAQTVFSPEYNDRPRVLIVRFGGRLGKKTVANKSTADAWAAYFKRNPNKGRLIEARIV